MPYTDIISRSDVQARIPEDVAEAMLGSLPEQSAALSLFRRTRMSTNQQRMPVLAALPQAYFVNGDTGLKQTTDMAWANKYLNVEELAAIVPIPEAVLEDAGFDVWGEVRPRLEEAVGRTLDAAIIFGTNKPASWPTAIVPAAIAAGNVAARGTNAVAAGGISQDLSDLFALVEGDGYDVNGLIATRAYRGRLRSDRNTQGDRRDEVSPTEVYGVTPRYPMRGLWPTGLSAAEAIAGDFSEGIIAVRRDFTYKVLTEATIYDNTGAVIYALAQQDMVALRITFRVAFQVANVMTRDNPDDGTRYPFAVLRSPAA